MIQQVISNAPSKLSGKEFEELILYRGRQMNDAGAWHLVRYGVQVSQMKDPDTGAFRLQPIASLPDFEACIAPRGRQIVFEAKVCTQPSYAIKAENDRKERQLRHLLQRAKCGALCFLVIHFNERVMKTKHDEPFTAAIRIEPDSEFLMDVLAGGTKMLTRTDAMLNGVLIPWNTFGQRGRKQTPDLSVLIRG